MTTITEKYFSWLCKTKLKVTSPSNEGEVSINLAERRFIKETSFDFHEWVTDEPLELCVCLFKNALFDKFIEEYPDLKNQRWFTHRRFSMWLRTYGEYKDYLIIEGENTVGRWITFI